MADGEVGARTIDAADAQRDWGALLDRVSRARERVIVQEAGTPVAAIISASDLEQFERLERERAHDFAVIDQMRAAFRDVPPEEIEREATSALAEVRAENHRPHARLEP